MKKSAEIFEDKQQSVTNGHITTKICKTGSTTKGMRLTSWSMGVLKRMWPRRINW